jgi:hypothetical protein
VGLPVVLVEPDEPIVEDPVDPPLVPDVELADPVVVEVLLEPAKPAVMEPLVPALAGC